MSAVLRPGLAVSRYRAGVVIRHHHDESRPEHHQKGQEIPRPFGFFNSPADRHHFRFQTGRGIHHKFVAHRRFSFQPARENTTGVTASTAISTPQTGTNTCWRCRKEEFELQELERRPSALRVHHRKLSGRSGGEGDSLRTIGLPPELPRRILRTTTRRLIVVRFHIPFWRQARSSGGKQKSHFLRAEEMANYRERLLTDSPTGQSFSTARRERSYDLSHVRETLNPGIPGHPPHSIFRCLRAVACLPRGRLAYRGSMQIRWTRPKSATSIQLQHSAQRLELSTQN